LKNGPKPIQAGHSEDMFTHIISKKASAAAKKPPTFACRFIAGDLKAFFLFFCFGFLHIDPSNDFSFCKFLPRVSKVKERG
jgi:hypothetical protein